MGHVASRREARRVVGITLMSGAGETVEADEILIGRIEGEKKRRRRRPDRGRVLHHATVVPIAGESYRLKDKRRAGIIQRPRLERRRVTNWLGEGWVRFNSGDPTERWISFKPALTGNDGSS